MNINEAKRIIQYNINFKTDFALMGATEQAVAKLDVDDQNVQRYYLSKKECLEVAQAFMVLAANMNQK